MGMYTEIYARGTLKKSTPNEVVAALQHMAGEGERPENWAFMLHANLKNYDGEIAKFFDWIDPYVEGSEGDYMGYSLYEETEPNEPPRSFFKKVTTW